MNVMSVESKVMGDIRGEKRFIKRGKREGEKEEGKGGGREKRDGTVGNPG